LFYILKRSSRFWSWKISSKAFFLILRFTLLFCGTYDFEAFNMLIRVWNILYSFTYFQDLPYLAILEGLLYHALHYPFTYFQDLFLYPGRIGHLWLWRGSDYYQIFWIMARHFLQVSHLSFVLLIGKFKWNKSICNYFFKHQYCNTSLKNLRKKGIVICIQASHLMTSRCILFSVIWYQNKYKKWFSFQGTSFLLPFQWDLLVWSSLCLR